MTPSDRMAVYAATLRQRWRLAAAIVAVAALAALALASQMPKSHAATAKVLVGQERQVDALLGTSDYTPDPERELNTGVQLITLEPIAAYVRQSLRLPESPAALVGKVTAAVDRNSNIVAITATDASAARAARLANAFAAGYHDFRARSARAAVDDAITAARARLEPMAPGPDRDALSTQLRRLEVAGAFQTGGVQIVRWADTASATTSPRPLVSGVIGGFLGLVLAAVVIVVLARTDRRMHGPRDLEAATGRRVVATIPRAPGAAHDALVTMATALWRTGPRSAQPAVLLLTSAGPGEGTPDVALGLVRALGAIGRRAIAIEADLRDPGFARRLGLEGSGGGVAAVLRDPCELEHELVPLGKLGAALPAGPAVRLPQPLLCGDRMTELVSEALEQADVVVLAGAPLGVTGDALPLIGLADGVLLVARLDLTRAEELERAVRELDAVGAPLTGVIATSPRQAGPLPASLGRVLRARTPWARPVADPAPGHAGTASEVTVG